MVYSHLDQAFCRARGLSFVVESSPWLPSSPSSLPGSGRDGGATAFAIEERETCIRCGIIPAVPRPRWCSGGTSSSPADAMPGQDACVAYPTILWSWSCRIVRRCARRHGLSRQWMSPGWLPISSERWLVCLFVLLGGGRATHLATWPCRRPVSSFVPFSDMRPHYRSTNSAPRSEFWTPSPATFSPRLSSSRASGPRRTR